ncbi:MAG: hypothetical protein QOI12_3499 [Alphaproteobacteria bacterium]|jgi:hypothetical protein|nr:hypothetical protein [Alphaproteobacteria bacterium]
MTQPPRQFQRSKSRPKTQPGRRVTLSDEEKQRYEELAKERDQRDKSYSRHLPDSPKR